VTTDVTVEADWVIVVKEPEIEVVTVTGGIIDVTVEADWVIVVKEPEIEIVTGGSVDISAKRLLAGLMKYHYSKTY